MENRILCLEKELSLVRRKLSILENNIQNDMKNYIDQYMQDCFEQMNINFQNNVDEEEKSSERKSENGKLKGAETLERSKPLKIKREANNAIQLQNTMIEEVEDLNDGNLKGDYEDTQSWSDADVSQDGNLSPEYVIVEDGDEDGSIVIELDENDEMMQTGEFDENGEYSEGFDAVGYDNSQLNDSECEIRIGQSVSLSKSSYDTSKNNSLKSRDVATDHDEVSSPTAAFTNSAPNTGASASRYPFKCQICLEVFKCASHFEKHKIKHVSDRPFKCDYCDKAYKRSHHLKEHQTLSHPTERHKILESGRSFRCLECPKVFTRPSLLASHAKTHSKEGGVRYRTETSKANSADETPQFHGFTLNL